MKYVNSTVFILLALVAMGCQHTTDGAKDDLRKNSIKASESLKKGFDEGVNIAKNAGNEAKKVGENASAAGMLTPRIKNAFNADPRLNIDPNVIDVDSTKEKVTISGHVLSQEMKNLAGKLAHEELIKAKATQILVNDLVVKTPAK